MQQKSILWKYNFLCSTLCLLFFILSYHDIFYQQNCINAATFRSHMYNQIQEVQEDLVATQHLHFSYACAQFDIYVCCLRWSQPIQFMLKIIPEAANVTTINSLWGPYTFPHPHCIHHKNCPESCMPALMTFS